MIDNLIRRVIPKRFRPIGFLESLVETNTGRRVAAGPFAGLRYIQGAVGSAYIPKLLGIYERELNGCVEQACAAQFPLIVDVGAAEGYYAVGLARRNLKARVIAFEMEEKGREALREMAELNGIEVAPKTEKLKIRNAEIETAHPNVSPISASQPFSVSVFPPQLDIRGQCEPDDLAAALAGAERSLVVCDVEGYEDVLLVPEKIPALAHATLLVEMHDFIVPGVTERITARFAATHHVERIWQEPRARTDFPFTSLGTRLLPARYLDWAVSEWRPVRMSWLWLVPKAETLKS